MKVRYKAAGSTAVAAAAAAVSPNAMAQNMHTPNVAKWDGPYVGLSLGAGMLDSNPTGSNITLNDNYSYGAPNTTESIGSMSVLNMLASGHAGFNWQHNRWVYGVEGDFSFLGNKTAHKTGVANYPGAYYGYNKNPASSYRQTRIDHIATLRGRVGVDFNGTLPYVTGGVAFADTKSSWTFSNQAYGQTNTVTKKSWQPGIVLGGGVEHQFGPHWTLRGEVLWMAFKSQNLANPVGTGGGYGLAISRGGSANFTNFMTTAKIGLSYRF
jgi:outer membrane immunogenic protein